jgi:NAD(P)-dependent dehydrogenase (short-subunit alcohol dehydrogenase family)
VTVHAGRFSDRAAVITGGASGIGLHTAKRLLAEGGAVALWDVDTRALRSAREALGPRCHPLEVDVAQWPSVEAGVQRTVAAMSKIDILIAGAGITGQNATLADYPLTDWQRVIDINLTGVFHACRAVVPRMLDNDYGRIVNISSIAGKEGNPNASAYSASKQASLRSPNRWARNSRKPMYSSMRWLRPYSRVRYCRK